MQQTLTFCNINFEHQGGGALSTLSDKVKHFFMIVELYTKNVHDIFPSFFFTGLCKQC